MSNEKEIKEINEINDYIKSRSEYKIGKNIFDWIDKDMEIREFIKKTKEKSNEKNE